MEDWIAIKVNYDGSMIVGKIVGEYKVKDAICFPDMMSSEMKVGKVWKHYMKTQEGR